MKEEFWLRQSGIWIHIKPMQVNLFYHLVMKSTNNRPHRDDDFCFTGTAAKNRF
jgi:hypothetical protein